MCFEAKQELIHVAFKDTHAISGPMKAMPRVAYDPQDHDAVQNELY